VTATTLDPGLKLVADHADDADFTDGADPASIERAERLLGVSFPPSYREFLARLGAGNLGSREFYGIIPGFDMADPTVPNMVGVTKELQDAGTLPADIVVIGSTGYGPYYVIDTRRPDPRGEGPVLVWFPGVSSRENAERDAENFGEFFTTQVERAVTGLEQ
jgi:antitoxin YobK